MLILAQLTERTADALVVWMVGGSAAIFAINQVLTFYKAHIKEQPTPADTYATKAEHAELRGRVDRMGTEIHSAFERLDQKRSVSIAGLHTKVEASTAEIRREIKADLGGVHERISTVLTAVSELKGAIRR
jgi:hypothetical protein